jgi:PAS domain S-box-containing protein
MWVDAYRRRTFKERQPECVNEFRIVQPGGEVRWIEARARISYDEAGRPCRMIGVYIDVTERRQARRPLDRRARSSRKEYSGVRCRRHASNS